MQAAAGRVQRSKGFLEEKLQARIRMGRWTLARSTASGARMLYRVAGVQRGRGAGITAWDAVSIREKGDGRGVKKRSRSLRGDVKSQRVRDTAFLSVENKPLFLGGRRGMIWRAASLRRDTLADYLGGGSTFVRLCCPLGCLRTAVRRLGAPHLVRVVLGLDSSCSLQQAAPKGPLDRTGL